MVHKIQLKIPKLSLTLIPDSNDMKLFAANYTLDEWKIITNYRPFINMFCENLDEAKKIANKILHPEEQNKKEDKNNGENDKNIEKSHK